MRNPQRFVRLRALSRRARHRYRLAFGWAFPAVGLGATLVLAFTVWFGISVFHGLPGDDALRQVGRMAQATAVYDRSDALAFTIHREQRTAVALAGVAPALVDAILAIEDQRFFEHRGFDPVRMLGAALANLRAGHTAQGGSTITQQLARQSFLNLDKTYRRKLQELVLAARLERHYTKDEILEFYLNKVYFGDGLYGVEAASRGYFGKSASAVSVGEAATLAGLVKSPSNYAPTSYLERATERRNVVLQAMLGTGVIDRDTFEAERRQPIALSATPGIGNRQAQYFKEEIRQELVRLFGVDRVYDGGLHVFSTLDPSMQQAAEEAVASGLERLDRRRKDAAARARARAGNAEGEPLQAALIAMDPATGHIRAMVGGRNFDESKFNRATQARRQPGSAFKPFVYAAALEAGYSPASMIRGLNEPVQTSQGDWVPGDGHSEADAMSLRSALTTSSNRAAVHLLQEVGIPQAVRLASDIGVGNVPAVPSLALGSGEVTLQSLTVAYAAFANRGQVPAPILIRRVEDADGQMLFEAESSSRPALGETAAFLMTTMLADVIDGGTGYGVRQHGFRLPAAGKTGTSNEYRDAWFIGFTPSLAAGVWVGFDQPRTILPNGFAGDVAVPLWTEFMKAATDGDDPAWVARPSHVTTATVCRLSGLLATEGCERVEVVGPDGRVERRSMAYLEYFERGTEPAGLCDLHPTRGFLGSLAAAFAGHERPAPPRLAEIGVPVAPRVAEAEVAPVGETVDPAEPPRRKRGFWSRIFRVRRTTR